MMQNKIILITGGTGGIGRQTALALAKMGAQIVVTGRDEQSGWKTVNELKQLSGNSRIELLLGDLSAQSEIRALASQFQRKFPRLDVLINNAGLVESQRRLTVDGVEAGFAVNVIAPFLLTNLLMDSLQASPTARVVNVTSGDPPGKIELDNLQAEQSFLGLVSYSHAKLVMMALMYEFALRQQNASVRINVCYPGFASTRMTQGVTPEMTPLILRIIWPIFKLLTRPDRGQSASKAARSSVYLAAAGETANLNGKYLNARCKEIPWPAAVLDPQVRQAVWDRVEKLIRK